MVSELILRILFFQSNEARNSFEDAILSKLDRLETNIQKISTLDHLLKKLVDKDSKLENIEERLRAIAEVVCSQRDKGDSPAEYNINADGRIRLKQKLKEALEQSKETSIAKLVSFVSRLTGEIFV